VEEFLVTAVGYLRLMVEAQGIYRRKSSSILGRTQSRFRLSFQSSFVRRKDANVAIQRRWQARSLNGYRMDIRPVCMDCHEIEDSEETKG